MISGSMGLELADSNFVTPGAIDLVLCTKVFGQVALHGLWLGLRGSPLAVKAHFGWVLSGTVSTEKQHLLSNDNRWQFWNWTRLSIGTE